MSYQLPACRCFDQMDRQFQKILSRFLFNPIAHVNFFRSFRRISRGLLLAVGGCSLWLAGAQGANNYATPYTFTTFAGTAGATGSTNGTGSAARFTNPRGVAVDSAGVVYVADSGNHTIRKITSGGVVTTLAGTAGSAGSTDATGTAARFSTPAAVAVDSAGNLYIADAGNHTIRRSRSGEP